MPSFFVPTGDLTAQESPPPVIYHPRQKKNAVEFVNNNFTLFCIGARRLTKLAKIEVPGLLDKVLYGEAPPRGPAPYPFNIPFLTEKVPLRIPFLGNGTPFTCLV